MKKRILFAKEERPDVAEDLQPGFEFSAHQMEISLFEVSFLFIFLSSWNKKPKEKEESLL